MRIQYFNNKLLIFHWLNSNKVSRFRLIDRKNAEYFYINLKKGKKYCEKSKILEYECSFLSRKCIRKFSLLIVTKQIRIIDPRMQTRILQIIEIVPFRIINWNEFKHQHIVILIHHLFLRFNKHPLAIAELVCWFYL